jgi:hypothetical protein
VPANGHPGAQPARAPGAHTCVGTNNDPLERSHLERERDARARAAKRTQFIIDFERRWPTAAQDSRTRTAHAAEALTEAEQDAALANIAAYLADGKQAKRKTVCAGFTYLEERRWTLLNHPERRGGYHDHTSEAAQAIGVLYAVAGKADYFRNVVKRPGAQQLYFARPVGPRLAALARAPGQDLWVSLNRQQAAAWEELLRGHLTVTRHRLVEGSRAPWPWPPSKDGKAYDSAAPPSLPSLSDEDAQVLAEERMR